MTDHPNHLPPLLQPRSSVFYTFDRLLVLYQGESAFHGPIKEMPAFLASMGHHMPVGYNPADFIIE